MAPMARHLLVRLVLFLPLALSLSPPRGDGFVHSGTPAGVPSSSDCALRKLAYEYGQKLMPARGRFKSLFDALQLGAGCGLPSSAAEDDDDGDGDALAPLEDPLPVDEPVLHVPSQYASLDLAVAASRTLRATMTDNSRITIALDAGDHYLSSGSPLQLGPADSGLTIRNVPGTRPVLSGGVSLDNFTKQWEPATEACGLGCFSVVIDQQDLKDITGLRLRGERQIRARYPNFDPERDIVLNRTQGLLVHNGTNGFIEAPTGWASEGNHGMNGIPGEWPPAQAPDTFVISADDWPSVQWPMNISGHPDHWTGEGDWGQFWVGVGGTCVDRSPAVGYWCAPGAPRKISVPGHPVGMTVNASQLPHLPYRDPRGAVVHSWGRGHWYVNMFEVGSSRVQDVGEPGAQQILELNFTRGGTMGAEGLPVGQGWFIEGVREELDMGREFFFDNRTRTLYYKPNSTNDDDDDDVAAAAAPPSPPPSTGFVATNLSVLINITGTQKEPARDIAIRGLTLRDTALTLFEAWGMPSGGDWALQRQGAITLDGGTENVTVDGNLFTRLDGNAIFFGGYHRGLTITNNEFSFLGNSAIAAWGDTSRCLNENCTKILPEGALMGPDGRGGDQPHGTVIASNLARELGIFEKQSSFYFQAVAARTTLRDNIVFNLPRAGINMNDGFGGGDVIEGNLLANCVRETGDHGPFNSWDRQPFITTFRDGATPSILPAPREIRSNLFLGTYNSMTNIDTDDGSAYYHTHHNVFAFAADGLKSDFGGNHHVWSSNLVAYVGQCLGTPNPFGYFKGFGDGFMNNTCIITPSGGYRSDCNLVPSFATQIHDNRVYSPAGNLTVCGKPFAAWQAQGHDKGTTVQKWPSDEAVVAEAKVLLGIDGGARGPT